MSDCIIIYKPVGKTTGTVFTNEEFKEFVINNPAIFKQYLEDISASSKEPSFSKFDGIPELPILGDCN